MLGSVGDDLTVDGRPDGTTVTFHRRLTRRRVTALPHATTGASPTSDTLPFALRVVGDPPTLSVQGAVDAFTVDEFRRELARLSRGGTVSLTVDLTEVTHLTSVGVDALAEVLRAGETAGRQATLVAPTGSPAAFVLDLVGLPRRSSPDDPLPTS